MLSLFSPHTWQLYFSWMAAEWRRAENKCLSAEWGCQINGMLRLVSRMNAQTGSSFNFEEEMEKRREILQECSGIFGQRKERLNEWKEKTLQWFAYYSNEAHDNTNLLFNSCGRPEPLLGIIYSNKITWTEAGKTGIRDTTHLSLALVSPSTRT